MNPDRDRHRTAGEHPDEVVTASYLDGGLDEESRDRVEAHLATCADCRAALALLALDTGPRRSPVPEGELAAFRKAALERVPGRKARRPPGWLMAAAAVALVAIGLAFWLAPRVSRDAALVERTGGGEFLALAPAAGSRVDARDLAFRFTPVRGADRYLVTVVDENGRTLATLETRAAGEPLAWPGDRPVPRGTLLWSVRAMNLDRVLAETRPAAFECR